MKITRQRLKEIIKEELSRVMNEKNEVKDFAEEYINRFGIDDLKKRHDAGRLDSIFDTIPIHEFGLGPGDPGEWHILEYLEKIL